MQIDVVKEREVVLFREPEKRCLSRFTENLK